MKIWKQFEVGDVVTRLGDDEQVITSKNDYGDLIEVECIKPDKNSVYDVGDKATVCPWSYDFVRSSNASNEPCRERL